MKKENEIIQGLWIGQSLSLMEQLSLKSFLACGHSFHLYVYRKIRNTPEGVIIKDANEILPKKNIFKKKGGFAKGSYSVFSNLFRYKLLLDKGGIWTDLDIVCLKPLDFENEYIFASENDKDGGFFINCGLIKTPPGCEFIKACYKEAKGIDNRSLRLHTNGMKLVTRKVSEFNLQPFIFPPITFCPIPYWEFKKVIESDSKLEITEKTYTIHLWNSLWKWDRKIKRRIINLFLGKQTVSKNALYDSQTLYGSLQKRYLLI